MAPARKKKVPRPGRLALLLRELRQDAGLSQRELARRMGVGVATVSSLESRRLPRLSTLRLLAEHLPGATPRLLLAPDSMLPEPASGVIWGWLAARFGFSAERVTLSIRRGG